MGDEDKAFIRRRYAEHGTTRAFMFARADERLPMSLRLMAGMQIRNWMREQPECAGWTFEEFDWNWSALLLRSLGLDYLRERQLVWLDCHEIVVREAISIAKSDMYMYNAAACEHLPDRL